MAKARRWGGRTRRKVDLDRHPATGERVQDLTALQLHRRLVSDALAGFPENQTEQVSALYLVWSVEAYRRIAHLGGVKLDDAYLQVRHEVAAAGGTMPTAPGS